MGSKASFLFFSDQSGGALCMNNTDVSLCTQKPSQPVAGVLPAFIPWQHGLSKEKKFMCDVMVEGLARQMRLFGIDASSMKQLPKNKRPHNIR
jgi:hypothetical protein